MSIEHNPVEDVLQRMLGEHTGAATSLNTAASLPPATPLPYVLPVTSLSPARSDPSPDTPAISLDPALSWSPTLSLSPPAPVGLPPYESSPSVPSPLLCVICKEEMSNNHVCPGCSQPVHVFCGTGEGEEGYGQMVWCNRPCQKGKRKVTASKDILDTRARSSRRTRADIQDIPSMQLKKSLSTLKVAHGGCIVQVGVKRRIFLVSNETHDKVEGQLLRYEKRYGSFLSLGNFEDNVLLTLDCVREFSKNAILEKVCIYQSSIKDDQFVLSKKDQV